MEHALRHGVYGMPHTSRQGFLSINSPIMEDASLVAMDKGVYLQQCFGKINERTCFTNYLVMKLNCYMYTKYMFLLLTCVHQVHLVLNKSITS